MDQVDGFECICPEQWVGATCQLGKGPQRWGGRAWTTLRMLLALLGCGLRGWRGRRGLGPARPLSRSQTPMSAKGSRAVMLFIADT